MTPLSQLPTNASVEEIKEHLQIYKIHTINILTRQIVNPNSIHLEPKELKTMTDTILNLEDSYSNTVGEGEQARRISRILDKYGDNHTIPPNSKADSQTTLSAEVVSND